MKIIILASVAAQSCGLVLQPMYSPFVDPESRSFHTKVSAALGEDDSDVLATTPESSFVQAPSDAVQGVVCCCGLSYPHIFYVALLIYIAADDSDVLFDGHGTETKALSIVVVSVSALTLMFIFFWDCVFCCDAGTKLGGFVIAAIVTVVTLAESALFGYICTFLA